MTTRTTTLHGYPAPAAYHYAPRVQPQTRVQPQVQPQVQPMVWPAPAPRKAPWYNNKNIVIGGAIASLFAGPVALLIVLVPLWGLWKGSVFELETKKVLIGVFVALALVVSAGTSAAISSGDSSSGNAGSQTSGDCYYYNSGDGTSARFCD